MKLGNVKLKNIFLGIGVISAVSAAASNSSSEVATHSTIGWTLFWMAILLIAAKISSLVERWGQPAVLGELVIGVILGNIYLVGINFFEPIKINETIEFLSEFGVIILLFQIGLESDLKSMQKVGIRAFFVAVIGVVVPFGLGTFLIGPWLLPDLSFTAHLFVGATLTATSVGITARVFQDLGVIKSPEAQIVLGAAVIDDVLGLIILAVVSAIATLGGVGLGLIAWITAKSILFLVGSIVLGSVLAPVFGKWLSMIHSGIGMKLTFAISIGLFLSFLAELIGLAPIVGAFAAGLILEPVHFKLFKSHELIQEINDVFSNDEKIGAITHKYDHSHIEELVKPIGFIFVPIFFVITGMGVRLETMFNSHILLLALLITVVAVIGKVVSGLVAGKVNKIIVGVGMIPRGEVGLIFAMVGKNLGVISDDLFSAIIIMVIITTLLTPPILAGLIKRK